MKAEASRPLNKARIRILTPIKKVQMKQFPSEAQILEKNKILMESIRWEFKENYKQALPLDQLKGKSEELKTEELVFVTPYHLLRAATNVQTRA